MSVSTSSRRLMVQAQAASGGERRRRRRPLLLRDSGQVGATRRRIVRRVLERNIEEQYRAGHIGTEDALHLFDELLHVAGPSLTRAINCLLYVVVGRDCPALGVCLFNRVARAKVPPHNVTYSILVGCCCHAGRLDLGFAAMGNIIKLGFAAEAMFSSSHLLRAVCAENKTSYAMDIALRRMPEFNCRPNVFSYSILLKGLVLRREVKRLLSLFT
ncbi:protein Rf1, mitochondrial-like [Triticum dicoccoides]|uniref:protein Rf1, mitochondrial-like n=1 Tax=Triticum dicoccoides TaxID=85692 RepID=UPI0018915F60|nr:protein Rf1, mitochondrial-like [Triticum dicoccoides]